MTKYLLVAWKQALDKKIEEECKKFDAEKKPDLHFKSVWFQVWSWVSQEIKNGEMMEEFSEFASAYCELHITKRLNRYKYYRLEEEIK